MMRALWTAASGMTAQQFNVDVISNNLANVNTTSYKAERAEFKDLLYQTLDRAYVLDGAGKPVNLEVGMGSRVSATVKDFSAGSPEMTDRALDVAINGEGFFIVQGAGGEIVYTRDGSFDISPTENGNMLTTSDGYPVLDETGEPIVFGSDVTESNIVISSEGDLSYKVGDGQEPLGIRIGLVKFPNKHALESTGGNFYRRNTATGEPVADAEMGKRSSIVQYSLEMSNVKVVNEMVKLIIAQRAYETNSKAIQSSDEMLGQANNLKR